MKLPWLSPVLEQSGPVVSVHLDTTRTDPQAAGELEARWARMRSDLAADGASAALLDQIEESVLSPSPLGGRHGRSVFASDSEILVDRVLPAPPRRESAHRGNSPRWADSRRGGAGSTRSTRISESEAKTERP